MEIDSAAGIVLKFAISFLLFRQAFSNPRRASIGSLSRIPSEFRPSHGVVSPSISSSPFGSFRRTRGPLSEIVSPSSSSSPFGSFRRARGLSHTSGHHQQSLESSAAAAEYKLNQALKLISDLERRSEVAHDQVESYKMRLADAEQRARTLELQYQQIVKNKPSSRPNFESSSSDLLAMSPTLAALYNKDMPRRQSLPLLDEIRRSSASSSPVATSSPVVVARSSSPLRMADPHRRQSLPPLQTSPSSPTTHPHFFHKSSPGLSLDSTQQQQRPKLRTDESSDVQVARQIVGYKQLSHGEFHPATASAKRSLADALRQQGNLDEAERLYHSALKILGVVYGGESPESERIRRSLNKLHLTKDSDANEGRCASETGIKTQKAEVCNNKNDVGDKIGIARSKLRRKVLVHGENHSATAMAKLELADALRQHSTSTKEAETLYLSALDVLKQDNCPNREEAIQAAQTGLLEMVWCEIFV